MDPAQEENEENGDGNGQMTSDLCSDGLANEEWLYSITPLYLSDACIRFLLLYNKPLPTFQLKQYPLIINIS